MSLRRLLLFTSAEDARPAMIMRTQRAACPHKREGLNRRASRQTELADQFPLHVVTNQTGNSLTSPNVVNLKMTEEHF